MILVDSSAWIDHLRSGEPHLATLLEGDLVAVHDFVLGEIALGHLKNRREILSLLANLPRLEPATHEEVLFFIDRHRLMGQGIGYIDVGLLAAAALAGIGLWTRDRRLAEIADRLGCGYRPPEIASGHKR